jgi:alpha-1,6-mannosyltransferase
VKSLHLTNAYHPTSGGVRTVYRALLDSANRVGRMVRLVVPGQRHGMEDVGEFGRIYYVKAPHALAFDSRYRVILPQSYLVSAANGIRAILRHEQPDVLEICDKLSLFYVAGLLRKGWMRHVWRPILVGFSAERFDDNIRAFVSNGRTAERLARWYMRNIYTPMFDYHVANSDYTAAELREALPPHRQRVVHVCPPGVDAEAFASVPATASMRTDLLQRIRGDERTVVLFYAGRLSPEKNARLLVETIAALAPSEPFDRRNYRLVIAGDGPLLSELQHFADAHAPGRVTFLGNIADRVALRQLLGLAQVVLHPNPREPFGIGPLEAMAAGIPVVLPDAGGVLSYATPDTTWLAAPRAPTFAAAVRAIVWRPDLAAARAARARRRAEDFLFPDVIDRMFQLYDQFRQERREPQAHSEAVRPVLDRSARPRSVLFR